MWLAVAAVFGAVVVLPAPPDPGFFDFFGRISLMGWVGCGAYFVTGPPERRTPLVVLQAVIVTGFAGAWGRRQPDGNVRDT